MWLFLLCAPGLPEGQDSRPEEEADVPFCLWEKDPSPRLAGKMDPGRPQPDGPISDLHYLKVLFFIWHLPDAILMNYFLSFNCATSGNLLEATLKTPK